MVGRTPKNPPHVRDAVEQIDVLADLVADRLIARVAEVLRATGERLGAERVQELDQGTASLPDDTIVDQTTVRAPRELYLRLAREGAFRSVKDGKRIYAFWGEVREALASRMTLRTTPSVRKVEPRPADDLDDVRRLMGVRSSGRG